MFVVTNIFVLGNDVRKNTTDLRFRRLKNDDVTTRDIIYVFGLINSLIKFHVTRRIKLTEVKRQISWV